MPVRVEITDKHVKVIYSETVDRNPPIMEVWEMNCDQCGQRFEMNHLPNSRDKHRFCGTKCSQKAMFERYKERLTHKRKKRGYNRT